MSTPAITPSAAMSTDTASVDSLRLLTLGLCAVSGYLDAFVFLRVAPVFASNQSGNMVLAGIAIGSGRWENVAAPLVSILAYLLGAASAVALLERDDGGRRRVSGVLALQVAGLSGMFVAMELSGTGHHIGRLTPLQLTILGTSALMMGAHATSVRSVNGMAVLTTAGTGAETSVGIALGRLGDPAARRAIAAVVLTVGGTVMAYLAGAATGALLSHGTDLGPILVLVPLPLLAVQLAAVLRPPSGSSPGRR